MKKKNDETPIVYASEEERLTAIRASINKKFGTSVAFRPTEENPADIKYYIPTGSRLLDSIIAKGMRTGIPGGRITEIAGLNSTGKSFLAMMIAVNAQHMGLDVVYFDAESSFSPLFFKQMGGDASKVILIVPETLEHVFEILEEWMKPGCKPTLFVHDSLSMTPCKKDLENEFSPTSGGMLMKPKVLGKACEKLITSFAKYSCTYLIVNQLYQNVNPSSPFEMAVEPFKATGGNKFRFWLSLSIWMTLAKTKKSFVVDDYGNTVGVGVNAYIEKSRLGGFRRECNFKLIFGGEKVGIQESESWLMLLKEKEKITSAGPWSTLKYEDGTEEKFQSVEHFEEKLKGEKFSNRVSQLLDEILIR